MKRCIRHICRRRYGLLIIPECRKKSRMLDFLFLEFLDLPANNKFFGHNDTEKNRHDADQERASWPSEAV